MSDPVMMALIGAAQAVIVVGVNALVAFRGRAESTKEHEQTQQAVQATHNEINGRMTELLVAAKAQGAQDQRDETRQDARDAKR